MQQFNLEFRGIKLGTATVNAETLEEAKSHLIQELNKHFTYVQFMNIEEGIITKEIREDEKNALDTM
jgi:hypothetical protein